MITIFKVSQEKFSTLLDNVPQYDSSVAARIKCFVDSEGGGIIETTFSTGSDMPRWVFEKYTTSPDHGNNGKTETTYKITFYGNRPYFTKLVGKGDGLVDLSNEELMWAFPRTDTYIQREFGAPTEDPTTVPWYMFQSFMAIPDEGIDLPWYLEYDELLGRIDYTTPCKCLEGLIKKHAEYSINPLILKEYLYAYISMLPLNCDRIIDKVGFLTEDNQKVIDFRFHGKHVNKFFPIKIADKYIYFIWAPVITCDVKMLLTQPEAVSTYITKLQNTLRGMKRIPSNVVTASRRSEKELMKAFSIILETAIEESAFDDTLIDAVTSVQKICIQDMLPDEDAYDQVFVGESGVRLVCGHKTKPTVTCHISFDTGISWEVLGKKTNV